MKVIVGLAVFAVLAALATNWGRHKGETLLHQRFDTALAGEVAAHPWAPLRHGRAVPADRVVFTGGAVTTARCHATLGSYTVQMNHQFSFEPAGQTAPRCPGAKLRVALGRATHVEIEPHNKQERLVFSDDQGHQVVQLQGRAS